MEPNRTFSPGKFSGGGGVRVINSRTTAVFSGIDLDTPLRRENVSFDHLVMFWNGETHGKSYFNLKLRVRFAGESWEPWVTWAKWGSGIASKTTSPEREKFKIVIDTLISRERCEAFELAVEGVSDSEGNKPIMHFIGATFWADGENVPSINSEWTGEIEVPPRSQMTQLSPDRRVICSPTCLGMVMDFFGKDIPTLEVAEGVYDHGPGIYGNWSFNIAYACSVGFPAVLHKLNGIGEAREWLAAGTPLIASIAYKEGELKGAPQKKSNGHLVVITGFMEKEGKEFVITNDPAAPDEKTVRRLYHREEFEKAWNRIVYIIFPH